MTTEEQLSEFATLTIVMPAVLGLSLLVSVELLSLAGIVPAPIPALTPQTARIRQFDPEGKILLQHLQAGRSGAITIVDEYRMQDGLPVGDLKTGDNVSFIAAQVRGVWTITKIEKQ